MINKAKAIHDFIISGGRAASISPQATLPEAEPRVTEMVNGVLITRPLKKVTEIRSKKTEKEPEVIDLQEYAKQHQGQSKAAASVQSINVNVNNKAKVIHDFITSNRRF